MIHDISKYQALPESTKEAHRKASMRYNEKAVKQIKLAFNRTTDADILAVLESCDNVQGYIKSLIRKDKGLEQK